MMDGLIINGCDVYKAKSRTTNMGDLVEMFINENFEHLSTVMYEKLEELAKDIEEQARELDDQYDDLESRARELEESYDELCGDVSDLEERVEDLEEENEQLKQTIESYLGEGEF